MYYEIAKIDRTKQSYPEKAIFHLKEVLKMRNDFIPALVLKGELHLAYGEVDKAITSLNKAIELEYNTAKAHLLKGYIYSSFDD